MRKIGAPVAKAAVYVFAFAFWAFAMLFTYNLVGMIARGHIEKYWFALLILMFGLGVLFAEFSRYLIRIGVPKAAALFQPAAPDGADAQNSNPQMTKDITAMAKNENPSFTFSQPVTINASTNRNAPGGIIGNAPIVIHQHFDKPTPPSPEPDAQTRDTAVVDSEVETASLDQLLDYAESLWVVLSPKTRFVMCWNAPTLNPAAKKFAGGRGQNSIRKCKRRKPSPTTSSPAKRSNRAISRFQFSKKFS